MTSARTGGRCSHGAVPRHAALASAASADPPARPRVSKTKTAGRRHIAPSLKAPGARRKKCRSVVPGARLEKCRAAAPGGRRKKCRAAAPLLSVFSPPWPSAPYALVLISSRKTGAWLALHNHRLEGIAALPHHVRRRRRVGRAQEAGKLRALALLSYPPMAA